MTTATLDATAHTFLLHLSSHGLVTAAAAAAGISPQAMYKRRQGNPGFARAWEKALEESRARLDTALRRVSWQMPELQARLSDLAAQLADVEMDPDSRATLLGQVSAIADRVEELKGVRDSEAAQEHQRRLAMVRAEFGDELNTRDAVAREFDLALIELEPAFKRFTEAQARCEAVARRAEAELPGMNLPTVMACVWWHHAPSVAGFLGIKRPNNKHQHPLVNFCVRPGE